MNKQLQKQNNNYLNQNKPISPEGLKHFGVLTQMQLSANNFTMQPINDNKDITQTYLSNNFKSYFIPEYKQYINFALEDKEEHFINHLNFGEIGQLRISTDYDYLNKMILCFQLPKLELKDEYLIDLLNSMFNDLNFDIQINKINEDNLNMLFPQIIQRLKYKYAEIQQQQKLINSLFDECQNFKINNELSGFENLIFQLLCFLSSNSYFNNIKNNVKSIINYIIKCIINFNINDYVIQAIFNFENLNIEKIINSLNDEDFKKCLNNRDNKLFILKINKTSSNSNYKLIELNNKNYVISELKNCKISLNPLINQNPLNYIFYDNVLFTYEEFKKYLFISQTKSLSFVHFYNMYVKEILTNQYNENISDYYIYSLYLNLRIKFISNLDILKNIDSIYKPLILSSNFLNQFLENEDLNNNEYENVINEQIKNKIIKEYYLSVDFVYNSLIFLSEYLLRYKDYESNIKFLIENVNNFIKNSIFETNDFLEFKKLINDEIIINKLKNRELIVNSLIDLLSVHFINYFFYDTLKVLIFDTDLNLSNISYVLKILSECKDLNIEEMIKDFDNQYLIFEDINEIIKYRSYNIKSYDDLHLIFEENLKDLNNLKGSNIIQSYILQHKKSILEELRWVLSEFELVNKYKIDIDFTDNQTIRQSIFNIGLNLIIYLIPFLKDYLLPNSNITNIKTYFNYILNKQQKINRDLLNKYQELFDDLNNNEINGFDYFTDLKYIEDIGYNIFDYIELTCDNQTIEKMGNEYIKIYDSLHLTAEHSKGINKLINGIDGIIYIPLHFFFCDYYKLSLPLLCLKESEILFKIKLKDLKKVIKNSLINTNLITEKMIKKYKFKSWLVNKYILIDESIRTTIINQPQEFLINQIQYSSYYNLNNSVDTIILNFKNCVRYLILYLPNIDIKDKPFKNIQLYFNGIQRTIKINYIYYNLGIKYNNFKRCEDDNIYIINFSLYAEDLQPSGSCDFSYINKVELKFEYFENVLNKYKNIKLQIYGLSYNILKTENGKGIIKFET